MKWGVFDINRVLVVLLPQGCFLAQLHPQRSHAGRISSRRLRNVLNDIECANQSETCDSLPVMTAPEVVELEDVVPQTIISKRREEKLLVLHHTMKYGLHGLYKCQDDGFLASTSSGGR